MVTKLNPGVIAEGSITADKLNANVVESLKTDSNFVTTTDLKTINGTSILGSGDITISGGSSDANVQAIDTGDVLDDVGIDYATIAYVDNKVANISLTDYATIAYVDGLVGDINSVLESIISGGATSIFPIDLHVGDNGDVGISLYNYIVQHQDKGYYAFEENEIVTYNNTKIVYFYYDGYDCYNYIDAGRLLLSSSGVVTSESNTGGGGA